MPEAPPDRRDPAPSRRPSERTRRRSRRPAGDGLCRLRARAHSSSPSPWENPPRTVRSGPTPVRSRRSSWKAASPRYAAPEGVTVRIADARDDVPVVTRPAGSSKRSPRSDDVQPPARVENVAEREQVELVRAAAVVQDEEPGRIALGRTLAEGQSHPWDSADESRTARRSTSFPSTLSERGRPSHPPSGARRRLQAQKLAAFRRQGPNQRARRLAPK